VASRTLPPAFGLPARDGVDLEGVDGEGVDLAEDFDVLDLARDDLDRLAGVLFLDDPQLDMSPPPYQPGVTPRRDLPPPSGLDGSSSDRFDALDGTVGADDDVE
jgi:hypothetical protein